MTTNEQIADLLLKQTFSERQELAEWLYSVSADTTSLDADDFAQWLEDWANQNTESEEQL